MAGKDLDAVPELEQPLQRPVEALGPLPGADREVGTAGVADEERVAGEDEPRLVGARAVGDGEARVLRAVARRVDRPQHDSADLDLGPVLEGVECVLGLRLGMDRDRDAVVECEAPVAGEVIGVRVRLDRPRDPEARALRGRQHRFDRVGWIDNGGEARVLVADEIGRAAEIVVQKLLEVHERRRYQRVLLLFRKSRRLPLGHAAR